MGSTLNAFPCQVPRRPVRGIGSWRGCEKLGDEGVGRGVVKRLVSASLDDFARAHDSDAIGQGDGFGLVVSHVDAGDAVVA